MGIINISEIKDKTLLKYAKDADEDKDGALDEKEYVSLFDAINNESEIYKTRIKVLVILEQL